MLKDVRFIDTNSGQNIYYSWCWIMVTRVHLHFLLVHFWLTTSWWCMEIQLVVESVRLALDIGDQRPPKGNIILLMY